MTWSCSKNTLKKTRTWVSTGIVTTSDIPHAPYHVLRSKLYGSLCPLEPILAPFAQYTVWIHQKPGTAAAAAAFHSQWMKLGHDFGLNTRRGTLFAVSGTTHHCPSLQNTKCGYTPVSIKDRDLDLAVDDEDKRILGSTIMRYTKSYYITWQ